MDHKIREREKKKGCAQNNPLPPLVLTAESIRVSVCTAESQTACMTLGVYAICCCLLKRPKLSKHWPFKCLPFMHVYLPQLCLLTVSVDTLSAALLRMSFLTSHVCCVFPHQRLETDLSYWMDHARSNDQGRQHHYDENAPIGPRDTASYRHGANVNYDYY